MDTTKKKKETKKGGEPTLLFQAAVAENGEINFNINTNADLVLLLGSLELLRETILTSKIEESEGDVLKQIPPFNPKVTLT